jgi:hypothetical protein
MRHVVKRVCVETQKDGNRHRQCAGKHSTTDGVGTWDSVYRRKRDRDHARRAECESSISCGECASTATDGGGVVFLPKDEELSGDVGWVERSGRGRDAAECDWGRVCRDGDGNGKDGLGRCEGGRSGGRKCRRVLVDV